jgi:RNA polymerase sigma factor (sigma-70 family)
MNPTDFRAFYLQCWKHCKPRLLNLTTNMADIEDVFAEAIARFWVKYQQGEIQHQDNLNGLVYVMAKNLWLNQLRKRQQFEPTLSLDDDNRPIQTGGEWDEAILKLTESPNEDQQTEMLTRAWKKLENKCQELLKATVIERERQQELLAKMDYKNTDTVKAAKYRCLQSLKKLYYQEAA